MENGPNENNKLSRWCPHGVAWGICQDCNLRKTSGFPEQKATGTIPYHIEGELESGSSAVWQFDTAIDERPRQRKPPLPESALLFRVVTPREAIVVRHHAFSKKLIIFTKHSAVDLKPGQVYDLLAGLLAYVSFVNKRKPPHDTWWVPKEIDRLISEKVARLVAAYESCQEDRPGLSFRNGSIETRFTTTRNTYIPEGISPEGGPNIERVYYSADIG